jgi:hypothetical protein
MENTMLERFNNDNTALHFIAAQNPYLALGKAFEKAQLKHTRDHWVTILHHPFTLSPKIYQYVNAMLPSAKIIAKQNLQALKFVHTDSCDLHPNKDSVVDPFIHELVINTKMLEDFLQKHGAHILGAENTFGWHAALLCFALGKEAYQNKPNDETLADGLQEIVWPLQPLTFTNGRILFPPAQHEHLSDPLCRLSRNQFALDFFYRVPRTLVSVHLSPTPMDTAYNTTTKHMESSHRPYSGTHGPNLQKMSHIARCARTRTNSLLFIFLCGWLSEKRFWQMTTTNIVVTPQFKDYLHADVVFQIATAIKHYPVAVRLLSCVFQHSIDTDLLSCFQKALILFYQDNVKHTLDEVNDLMKCHTLTRFQTLTLNLTGLDLHK